LVLSGARLVGEKQIKLVRYANEGEKTVRTRRNLHLFRVPRAKENREFGPP